MTKHPIEVITSVERRRRWSREDKERLVAACLEPGAVLSEIARAAGAILLQQMSADQVKTIAGPGAAWPER